MPRRNVQGYKQTRHRILGLVLYRLTIGHLEILHKIKNPYMGYDDNKKETTPLHIGDFLAVVSNTYLEEVHPQEGCGYLSLSRRIKRKLNTEKHFFETNDSIVEYILDKDVYKPPKIKNATNVSAPSNPDGVPYTTTLISLLCRMGVCSCASEAKKFSVSDALWHAESHYEMETGESRLVNSSYDSAVKDVWARQRAMGLLD